MPITVLALLAALSHQTMGTTLVAMTALASDTNFLQAPNENLGGIKGRVVDATTGIGLGNVLVAIEGGPSTHTDATGGFSLPGVPAGRRRLYASLVGFTLVRREVEVPATGLELTIPLSEGTGTYTETVTVAADRFRPAEPGVVAQQVLGSADLQSLRGVLADDPMRAVQVLPGVATNDDLRSEFTVRASAFANVNMTVDGFATPHILHTVRAVEDYSGSGSVAMINSDILSEIALLSGSYPQRFGNRTGAEVDFHLRDGSRDRTHTRLAISGTNASAVLEGPLGRAKRGSWLLSARQSYLDLILNQIDTENDLKFGFTDAQGKLAFDLSPSQRLDVTFIAGRSKGEERSGDIDRQETFVGRNASVVAMGGWRLASPRGTLAVRAQAATNTFENTDSADVVTDDGYDRQGAVRADLSVPAGRWLHTEGGVNLERIEEHRLRLRFIDGFYRGINDYTGDAMRWGGYLQARLTAGRVTLSPGARVDRRTASGTPRPLLQVTDNGTFSPWVQGQLSLPWGLSVRGGTGIYQQFPGLEQAIGGLAAPSAFPLRAVHYDAGFEQRLGASIRWQVGVYYRDEDRFYHRPQLEPRLVNKVVYPGSKTAPFEQTLYGSTRGVEVLFQRKSARGVSGWISYAYGHNRYTDVARGQSFDGDNDQRHAFNIYGFYRLSDRFSLSAKARAGSNTPAPGYFAEASGNYTLSTIRNNVRLPTYSRVDLRANRTFNWSGRRLTVFAEVINILNRDNVRFVPPFISSRTGRVFDMFEQMVPVLPSIGVLFEF